MTLLAAFQTLLYRHTAAGFRRLPTANRREIEELIGFVNSLVMRTTYQATQHF